MSPLATDPIRRRLLLAAAALAGAKAWRPVHAQERPIRFQLETRFDGVAALFLAAAARGYYRAEGLNVSIDPGSGAGGTVTRVASGAYDMGCADLAALMEFHANNPGARNKPVAVMIVHNNTPAAAVALASSGIRAPADLAGRRLAAPAHDASRRAWSVFTKEAKIPGGVVWAAVEQSAPERMLLRGEVDAIAATTFGAPLELEALGAKPADIVLMPFAANGVKFYGSAIIVGEEFLKANADAVRRFLRAYVHGVKDLIADPRGAIAAVRQRDRTLDETIELRRLLLALDTAVLTPDARADGFGDVNGARLVLMASQVSDAYGTRLRVNPNAVWNGSFLPMAGERNVFAAIGAR